MGLFFNILIIIIFNYYIIRRTLLSPVTIEILSLCGLPGIALSAGGPIQTAQSEQVPLERETGD